MDDLGLNLRESLDRVPMKLVYEEDETPMGITLHVVGPDSRQFKAQETANNNENIDRRRRNKKVTSELIQKQTVKLLAACVVGWDFYEPALKPGSNPPEFNKKNVLTLLDGSGEIREQVDNFISDRANFRKRPDPGAGGSGAGQGAPGPADGQG